MSLSISKRDQQRIWHPYTQSKTDPVPIPIASGKGATLIDEKGNKYIDAISSWWVNIHGHSHPYIAGKIAAQAEKLEQVIFAGFTHEPAVNLAERILKILPGKYSKVFYSDNGSTAVEVALKMALQYWHNKERPRTKVIAFQHAYHGDTFGAMSASARGVFTKPFQSLLFDAVHIEPPLPGNEKNSLRQLKSHLIVRDDPSKPAAFIFEPLVMGAGGMLMYDAVTLDQMISLCRKNNVFTIADEVMTGFGRTGKLFATNYLEHQPDIVCLSKGLTGGFLPLGLTACREEIFQAFHSDDRMKTFFHGHSFTANPLACSAALASLDLAERKEFRGNMKRINASHRAISETLSGYSSVKNLRVTGTILAFEFQPPESGSAPNYMSAARHRIYNFFISRKVLLRPLGNTVYIMPPMCISDKELQAVYDSIVELCETEWPSNE